jgi:uncharacterized membrane protein
MSPEESAIEQLRMLVNVQPTHLNVIAWLLPLAMAALVGLVLYQIWKIFREERSC